MDFALPPPPSESPKPRLRRPLGLVALIAWILPGAGQLMLGQGRKAFAMAFGILGLYATGLWLCGFTAVRPDERTLELAAQVWAGGPTGLTWWFTQGITQTTHLPYLDVGRLYVAIGSLLNIVAITDAVHGAQVHNRTVMARRADAAARTRARTASVATAPVDRLSDPEIAVPEPALPPEVHDPLLDAPATPLLPLSESVTPTDAVAADDHPAEEVALGDFVPDVRPSSEADASTPGDDQDDEDTSPTTVTLEGGVRAPEAPLLGVVSPKLERTLDIQGDPTPQPPRKDDPRTDRPSAPDEGERS